MTTTLAEPPPQGRITRVSIEGFRSLRRVEQLALPQLAVLIGANGSGKSTLLRFFDMLRWMLEAQRLQAFVLHHGGGDDLFYMGARQTPQMRAEVCIQAPAGLHTYSFTLQHLSARDTVMVVEEAWEFTPTQAPSESRHMALARIGQEASLPELADAPAKTICHLLGQCVTYQFHDTSAQAAIHKRWDVSDCARLRPDGGNLAAVLLDLQQNERQHYKLIVRQIQRVLPAFADFVLEPVAGKVALRWVGPYSDKTFGAHLSSDGSLRLFCLLTLLNLPPDRLPGVLFFDEPELGLHPHAITLVAQMMKRVAQTRQVFIATQSPDLVDCFELENIIVASHQQGATLLRNLPRSEYQSWLDDDYLLSDIWLKNPVGDAL